MNPTEPSVLYVFHIQLNITQVTKDTKAIPVNIDRECPEQLLAVPKCYGLLRTRPLFRHRRRRHLVLRVTVVQNGVQSC
jgi:hypothetical protein